MSFDIPSGKLTPQQSIILNRVEKENLIEQLEVESSDDLPMHELLGLYKQLRSIRGSLKVEAAKKVQLEERIKKEKCKLEEIRDNPEYDDGI